MIESKVSSQMKRHLESVLQGAVIIKHSDGFTSGIPDSSVTWGGITVWLEVKRVTATSKLKSKGVQQLMMERLYDQSEGKAFYVIFDEVLDQTSIIEPKHFGRRDVAYVTKKCPDKSYDLVANFIAELAKEAKS